MHCLQKMDAIEYLFKLQYSSVTATKTNEIIDC